MKNTIKIKDVTSHIEKIAPLYYAENFDNVGLLIGNYETSVTGILITLDTLENIVDEAIEKKCNLIISFHPIIFSGIKKFNGKNYVERVVIKAIKNNIAIYATHTSLDNSFQGVNAKICEVLGLKNYKILIPKTNIIQKLTTYVPKKDADNLRTALFKEGAGSIGNYKECSFNIEGKGTYNPNQFANPTIGEKGILHTEDEILISVIFEKHLEKNIIKSLISNHPYEEVAFEIVTINNSHQQKGMGMIGELDLDMNSLEFLQFVKSKMKTDCIRHSALTDKPVKKVAVLGGSGSFALNYAIKQNTDVFITADFKYHEFFKAEKQIVIADIGHYESEQFTKNLLFEHLTKKFRNFAVVLSNINTNPINYL